MRIEDMEYLNYQNIIHSIDELNNPSRATIAKRLSLSRTTVSNITGNLISWGVIRESEELHQKGASRGRPGSPLVLSDDKWFALGASFYSSSWNFVLCNLRGNIVEEYTLPVSVLTPENLVESLLQGIGTMIRKVKGKLLPAIGLGLPGVVDSENGDILWAYDLQWHERINVAGRVRDKFGIPAFCLNRYTLAGLAEFTYANPDGEGNMIYVGLGSGIRSAIFINGRLLEGASFSAGRIGHVCIDPNGPLCECGKHGCLLAFANEKALLDEAYRVTGKTLDVEELCSLGEKGDTDARHCLDFIAAPLVKALLMMIDIVNPKKIVLGGPIGYSSSYLVRRIREVVSLQVFEETPYSVMKIEQGQLKDIGSALGASTLVLQKKLELIYGLMGGKTRVL